eukprot:1160874-Pelagomonas_calceolata.AAC.10
MRPQFPPELNLAAFQKCLGGPKALHYVTSLHCIFDPQEDLVEQFKMTVDIGCPPAQPSSLAKALSTWYVNMKCLYQALHTCTCPPVQPCNQSLDTKCNGAHLVLRDWPIGVVSRCCGDREHPVRLLYTFIARPGIQAGQLRQEKRSQKSEDGRANAWTHI